MTARTQFGGSATWESEASEGESTFGGGTGSQTLTTKDTKLREGDQDFVRLCFVIPWFLLFHGEIGPLPPVGAHVIPQ
jgi:hypothetical protein